MIYEVVWDGSHQGCDRDLLCLIVASPTSPSTNLHAYTTRDSDRREAECDALLVCLHKQPCTRGMLKKVTGFSEEIVSRRLASLRRDGSVILELGLYHATGAA